MFNGYVTVQWLQDNKACKGQVANFLRTFGNDEAALTRENLVKAEEAGLNLNWLAKILKIPNFCYQAQDKDHKGSTRMYNELVKLGEIKNDE